MKLTDWTLIAIALAMLTACQTYALDFKHYDFKRGQIVEPGTPLEPEIGYFDRYGRWYYYDDVGVHGTATDTTAKGCGHPGC